MHSRQNIAASRRVFPRRHLGHMHRGELMFPLFVLTYLVIAGQKSRRMQPLFLVSGVTAIDDRERYRDPLRGPVQDSRHNRL